MTTAARVPRAPSAATMPGTVAGGVQMIARSGIEGRLAMSAWQGIPSTAWYFGLTASTGPSKPAPARLRATTLPTEARVWLAPIRATDFGLNTWSRLRMVMPISLRPRSYRCRPSKPECRGCPSRIADHDVAIRASGEAHEAMPGVARGVRSVTPDPGTERKSYRVFRARHPAFDPVEVPIGLMQ